MHQVHTKEEGGGVQEHVPDLHTAIGDTSDVTIPSVFLSQQEYLELLRQARQAKYHLLILMQLDDFISW